MTATLPRDIGSGRTLRRSCLDDADALAAFHASLHALPDGTPDPGIARWVRDLMTRSHPTFAPEDFTIVEHGGEIVSSLCLIGQTWAYEGETFGVGRPELVSTHPDHRRRGLVRLQMDEVHAWSAKRGHVMQVIVGIPWFYRQFGYEMALACGGGRTGYPANVPELAADTSEPFTFRPATAEDAPFVARVQAAVAERYGVTCERDAETWRHEIAGRTAGAVTAVGWRIVERHGGTPVGVVAHHTSLFDGTLTVRQAELGDAASWFEVGPSLLRYLRKTGQAYAAQDGQRWSAFSLNLGVEHPAYGALHSRLPRVVPPYAWYVRVADVACFLRRVRPALERRLAQSDLRAFTGDLHLSFYTHGVRLGFESGRITTVEPWRPGSDVANEPANEVAFPNLTFLHLLMGHRSFAELNAFFADCGAKNDRSRALASALFPQRPSHVWAVS